MFRNTFQTLLLSEARIPLAHHCEKQNFKPLFLLGTEVQNGQRFSSVSLIDWPQNLSYQLGMIFTKLHNLLLFCHLSFGKFLASVVRGG